MEATVHPKSIVILDFGGQYAHLIANRVRRLGAYSMILPPETPSSALANAAGIILSGGPQSVYEAGSPQADPAILQLGIPVLGLCYGHQWLAHVLGGEVRSAGERKEYGHTPIRVLDHATPLMTGLPDRFSVWMSHGDEVHRLPPGFRVTAASDTCPHAAMVDEARRIYGIQFHIEVTHSQNGMTILDRFVKLCDPAPWSVESFASHVGAHVTAEVGERKVFMLVSGGVDSTVAFTLLSEVLGPERVQGLLVDTGLMRANEIRDIQTALGKLKLPNLHVEDASEEFFTNLRGVADPERKRTIIGDTFLAVQRRVSERMGLTPEKGWMLGQGTIYPDTIETGGTKHADHIKTHHNRVPAVQEMIDRGLVIEPLKELYKDEVRTLGEELGLPHDLVWRHPFPGPGLGVRILCQAEGEGREMNNGQLTMDHGSVPSVVLPVRSVGVQGDGRTYRSALALFSADDPCGVTDAHRRLATTIPNANPAFNRVLLCTSHAKPVEFHASSAFVTRERADLLRAADAAVDTIMRDADLYQKIWQFPVVLLPIGIERGQSIVLRPVDSTEAMTATAADLPREVLRAMTDALLALPGIDAVFLDLTSKPPGTIEWE
jgi:GMP synthase (glutamine-hydrolysing)